METDIKSILESLLFVAGEPMSFSKLGKVTGEKENILKEKTEELAAEYKNRNGGLRVIIEDGKAQMVTAGENADAVEKLIKIDIEGELSRSALETISIIAYRGPISRSDIEEIRGVNTSFTLRQLSIRGLIEKMDNPHDARAYLYRISFDLLRHMGVEKVEDLPNYRELREKELVSERIVKNSEEEAETAEVGTENDGAEAAGIEGEENGLDPIAEENEEGETERQATE